MKLSGVDLRLDYGDPAGEAIACRSKCALFDFSFVKTVRLQGKHARRAVENFASRSLAELPEKKIAYALHVDTDGNVLSDLTIWKIAADIFEVMSGRAEDVADLLGVAEGDLYATDLSADRAIFALQGPRSLAVLRRLGAFGIEELRYFHFATIHVGNIPCIVGRLGYTGEAGFEIIAARADAPRLWRLLSAQAKPAGFIAADALRIEAGFVLFANEFRLPVTPHELGLERFYAGTPKHTPRLKLVSFLAETEELTWPWRPAAPEPPSTPGDIVVTSACYSALAKRILGLGYVSAGTEEKASLRDPAGTFQKIEATPLPFYDPAKLRPRAAWDLGHSQATS
jgi:glycine cleavage system aminomethyltransferase T